MFFPCCSIVTAPANFPEAHYCAFYLDQTMIDVCIDRNRQRVLTINAHFNYVKFIHSYKYVQVGSSAVMQRLIGILNVLTAMLAQTTVCMKTVKYSTTLVLYVILSLLKRRNREIHMSRYWTEDPAVCSVCVCVRALYTVLMD